MLSAEVNDSEMEGKSLVGLMQSFESMVVVLDTWEVSFMILIQRN